jgi:Outer membrane protein beta-barrel domain
MKQLLFSVFICILSASCLNGQATKFGFTAGTAIANYTSKVDGETETEKSVAGITIGALVDIAAGKNFSFQPGLNFIQKGTKSEEGNEKAKLVVNSIELPLNLLYNSHGSNGSFFIGAGPSFAFAISGKLKFDDGTTSEEEDIEFGNSDEDFMKGLDIGANILAGYQLPGGFFFSAGYNAGLNNLFPGGSDDGTLKSHYFSIKLGFLLKGAAKK